MQIITILLISLMQFIFKTMLNVFIFNQNILEGAKMYLVNNVLKI